MQLLTYYLPGYFKYQPPGSQLKLHLSVTPAPRLARWVPRSYVHTCLILRVANTSRALVLSPVQLILLGASSN